MMGIDISGYFVKRLAEGVLDLLYANIVAFRLGDECAMMICIDNCGIKQEQLLIYRKRIAEKIGISVESVLISCTHTHTGPAMNMSSELVDEYKEFLGDKLEEGATLAFADLKDAKMGYVSNTSDSLTVKIENNTASTWQSGNMRDYSLEAEKDGEWYSVKQIGEYANTMELMIFAPGQEMTHTFKFDERYGKLASGKYRVVKSYWANATETTEAGEFHLVCEFTVE
jgi:hypothetical protein